MEPQIGSVTRLALALGLNSMNRVGWNVLFPPQS